MVVVVVVVEVVVVLAVVEDLMALVESAANKGFKGLCGLGTFLTNVGRLVVTVVTPNSCKLGRMIRSAG